MTTATAEHRLTPRVNVFEDSDGVTIEAEFPGVAKDGAEVEVRDGHLILKGAVKSTGTAGRYHIQERRKVDFFRAFALSDAVDTSKVEANLSDGVLTVRLPKADRLRPRTVAVN